MLQRGEDPDSIGALAQRPQLFLYIQTALRLRAGPFFNAMFGVKCYYQIVAELNSRLNADYPEARKNASPLIQDYELQAVARRLHRACL